MAGCAHSGLNLTGGLAQPAGGVHRGAHLDHPGHRHQGIGPGQQRHRDDQGRDRHPDRDRRPGLHQRRTTGRRSSRRTPASGAPSAGPACFGGAGLIFFAYIGFDAVTTAAQEAKNPQRDMPIGILGSLAICTVLYVVVSAVLTGMVHYPELNNAAPVAYALEKVGAAASGSAVGRTSAPCSASAR